LKLKADSESQLAARLLRALAHRIRGDLSVITNDLSYLATLVDPTEIERSQERCRKIASELSVLRVLTGTFDKQDVGASRVAELFHVSLRDVVGCSADVVSVDEGALQQAVQIIRQLLGSSSAAVEQTESLLIVTLTWPDKADDFEVTSSFSAGIATCIGEGGVVPAAVVDYVVRDFGWQIEMGCRDRVLKVSISMPLIFKRGVGNA
jgi:hypothetical protein